MSIDFILFICLFILFAVGFNWICIEQTIILAMAAGELLLLLRIKLNCTRYLEVEMMKDILNVFQLSPKAMASDIETDLRKFQ